MENLTSTYLNLIKHQGEVINSLRIKIAELESKNKSLLSRKELYRSQAFEWKNKLESLEYSLSRGFERFG